MRTLKYRLFAGLCLLPIVLASVAHADDPKRTEVILGMRLYGTSAEAVETQTRLAGTQLEALLRHRFADTLEGNFAAGLQLESGSSRARFQDEFRPRQGERLREVSLLWAPTDSLQFRAGAIDQDRWQVPLLLQSQSFPAVREEYSYEAKPWKWTLVAQQAFAADASLAQPWGRWPESPAAFYFERLTGRYGDPARTFAQAHVSHFFFENLSAPIAYNSRFLGNHVRGNSVAQSAFETGFQGFELGTKLGTRFGIWEPVIDASVVLNGQGARENNRAFRVHSAVAMEFNGDVRLTPALEYFHIEADSAPAVFNDKALGHTNRRGVGAELKIDWIPQGLETSLRWTNSQTIAPNPFQSELRWVQLLVRAQYDLL